MTTTPLARLHDADAATRRVALLQIADEENADALPNVIALLEQDPAPKFGWKLRASWQRGNSRIPWPRSPVRWKTPMAPCVTQPQSAWRI